MEDETCQSSNWGYCAPVTEQGCECQQSWSFAGSTCSSYCCNPDNDVRGDWCYVIQEACQGTFYGYCRTTSTTTSATLETTIATAGRLTREGCRCPGPSCHSRNRKSQLPCMQHAIAWCQGRTTWTLSGYSDSPCTASCCNPNGFESEWCFVEDETCQQSNWGFCTPVTKQGCECQQSWTHGGVICSSFCCNPDDDVGDWCYVVQEACEGSFWGYCNVTRSTTLGTTSTTTASGRITLERCACRWLSGAVAVQAVRAAWTTRLIRETSD